MRKRKQQEQHLVLDIFKGDFLSKKENQAHLPFILFVALLIILNIFLLTVGCVMDIFSAIIVVVPLVVPIAQSYGINMTHLGIIFLTNLEIGYSTPPIGINLFISSSRFSEPVVTLYRAVLPFLGIRLIGLFLITYFPVISLFIPRLFS